MTRVWAVAAVVAILSVGCGGSDAAEESFALQDSDALDEADASGASAQPPAVVFDIDGTLTTTPLDPVTPRAGAREAVLLYQDKGYEVVYVTSRPAVLEPVTLAWLRLHDFPEAPLELSPELLPGEEESARIKSETLMQYEQDLGVDFVFGYGDSSLDFIAYGDAGIPVGGVFALRREGRADCESGEYAGCLTDFIDHLDVIASRPDA